MEQNTKYLKYNIHYDIYNTDLYLNFMFLFLPVVLVKIFQINKCFNRSIDKEPQIVHRCFH